MFIRLIRLFILQIFFIRFYHSTTSYEHLSIHYILTNASIALNECRNQFSSLTSYEQCKILLTNSFTQGIGSCTTRCLNQTHIHHNAMQFDIIITLINGTFSFYSRTCFTCTFNSSCNSTFVNDWIHWQSITMNEMKRTNAISNENNILHSKDYHIYGSAFNNKIHLCTDFDNLIQKYDINGNVSSSITMNQTNTNSNVHETSSCSRYDHRHVNITNKIYNLVRRVMSFSETNQALKIEQKEVTMRPYRDKSVRNKLLKIVGILICIILVMVLFLLLIVCLVHRRNYRQGYLSTEASATF